MYIQRVFFLISLIVSIGHAQVVKGQQKSGQNILPVEVVYKTIDTTRLTLRIYALPEKQRSRKSPAIVYFFGGGWTGRNPLQFHEHALRYAEKGIVTILADYRVKNVHGTSPMEALLDAKSAMRYVRGHANKWRIDEDRIAAAGGSAGGHLAAACFTNERFNEAADDLRISAKPNALLLFNPVIDNGPDGYGYERVSQWFPDFSPMHMIKDTFPETIFFLGTKDKLIPVSTAEAFQAKVQATGSGCALHLYEGAGHGFFNQPAYREAILPKVDTFLHRIGFMELPETALQNQPGVVIGRSPSENTYLGSPSIVILPSGDYLAGHDFFGAAAADKVANHTRYFVSKDKGQTWTQRSIVNGMYWSNLFLHRGALYALGTRGGVHDCVIRRSDDEGRTWTDPVDEKHGLLLRRVGQMGYHCAPMPMAIHNGRIWRAMEYTPDRGWGKFQSVMLSADTSADLLDASSWRVSTYLSFDTGWHKGYEAWLEGNAVVGRGGKMYNILRVHYQGDDIAAMVHVSKDGRTQTFDPEKDFIRLPGACKKFVIRFDPKTRRYWTLTNYAPRVEKEKALRLNHKLERARNTLVLLSSKDLRNWTKHVVVAYSEDIRQHGYQYADWQFEGEDIIAAVRTALGERTHGSHDANQITFHRIRGFRTYRKVILPD